MTFYLLNILFFILVGVSEGIFWHLSVNKISTKTAKYLHMPLVAIRAAWFIFVWYKLDKDTVAVFNLFLCYPLFHLGFLYQTRHWLQPEIYKSGFFSDPSSTSTSVLDRLLPITFGMRWLLFLIGSMFCAIWNT